MRRHTSVLRLFARSSFHKVLAVLAAMTAAECGIFYLTLRNGAEEIAQGAVGLERLIVLQPYVFIVGVLAIVWILSKVGGGSGSREEYTLRRLGIPEKIVTLWQWAYNTACFMLMWMVQALVALGLCFWYQQVAPEGLVNHQTMVVAFYTNGFLHRLIPLADFWSWVLLLATFLSLGLAAAWESYKRRHVGLEKSNFYWFMYWFAIVTNRRFLRDSDSTDILIIGVCAICVIVMLVGILKGGVDDEEKPEADA